MQVGGENTATLVAVSNTLANCWGLLVPILGVWVKARFDSYMPLFVQVKGPAVSAGRLRPS